MSGKSSSPTIADVARESGVSISTVSRYLNGSTLVAEQTVGKVRSAIQRLGYQPRSAARSLALRRTNTLGILLEDIGTFFFSRVVGGAEEVAFEEGYSLLLSTRWHSTDGDLPALGPFNTDGLLAVSVTLSPGLQALRKTGYPIVSLYQPAPKALKIPFITIQNKRGVFLLIEHLLRDHGLRKIGFMRGPVGNYDSYWREQGFRQAMKKYRVPVDETLVSECGFNSARAHDVILGWRRRGNLPQAIFTGDDDTALYVMLTLYELGLRVPEDIAVVGFDDTSLASSLVPPLTTVRAPIAGVGREGVLKLIQLIQTGSAAPVTTLATGLVIRRSCGCSGAPDTVGAAEREFDAAKPARAEREPRPVQAEAGIEPALSIPDALNVERG
jgi:DNA-binding LacI/PurR family transcriptional regulator